MSKAFPFLRLPPELQIKVLRFCFLPYYIRIHARQSENRIRHRDVPDDFVYYANPTGHCLSALLAPPDIYEKVQLVLYENPTIVDLECVDSWRDISNYKVAMESGVLPMLSSTPFNRIKIVTLGLWYRHAKLWRQYNPIPALADLINTSQMPNLELVCMSTSLLPSPNNSTCSKPQHSSQNCLLVSTTSSFSFSP